MPYIGKEPVRGSFVKADDITTTGSASYTLLKNGAALDPGQAERMLVSVNGVTQEPGTAYTVSATQSRSRLPRDHRHHRLHRRHG